MNGLKKNIIYLVLTTAFALIAFVPSIRHTVKELFFPIAEVENAVNIAEADYDIELKGINTADTNLKQLKGGKPLFLNFWGTWCPPCREEWPTIEKLYASRRNDVDFVLIAMQDKEDAVRKFITENNYTAPVYIAQSPISEKLLPKVFPTTYLLSKDGRILMKEDASRDWNADSVHQFISNILK